MTNLIGQSLGRYHILEQLGEGGMAIVYKAYDTRLERDVAVKVIRTDLFGQAVIERILKRFEREAKALARLSHPNIVKVHDYGEHEGAPYLVLEYLSAGTLKQRLGKPISWQEAVRLLIPVAQALDYAHEHNIIHRDIKPSNILLTEKGQPMLTDFGIAKLLDAGEGQTLTATGVGVGTPEYMAPEQGLGKEVDARTDVYSLGVVFYELVTGRKPYVADTPMAVVFKHLTDPLPRPKTFAPNLPDTVEKILIKAMAKKPEDRYADMNAFAVALDGLLTRSPLASLEEEPEVRAKAVRGALPPRMEDSMTTIEQDESQEARLHAETVHPATDLLDEVERRLTPKPKRARRLPPGIGYAALFGGVFLACLLAMLAVVGPLREIIFPPTLTATATPTLTPTATNTSTRTRTPTLTPMIATPTNTLLPPPSPTNTLLPLPPPTKTSRPPNPPKNTSPPPTWAPP